MKFYLAFLFIFAIIFSNFADARRVRRHRYRHRHRGFATNLYQFALGMVTEATGGVDLDKCLPAEWKNANNSEEGQFENNVGSNAPIWQKILGYLGKAIDVMCVVKTVVESLIDFITGEEKKFMRRWIRLYLQGKRVSYLSRRGWFSSAVSWVGDKVTAGAKAVASGVTAVYKTVKNAVTGAADWIGKKVGQISDAIKNVITGAVEKIYDAFNSIRAKITAFVKSDLFQKIKTFVICLKTLYQAVKGIIELVKGITEKAAQIANFPAGWVGIVIGLICAWKDFAQVIKYIVEGIGASGTKRWNYFGKALGKLGFTLATF